MMFVSVVRNFLKCKPVNELRAVYFLLYLFTLTYLSIGAAVTAVATITFKATKS